METLLKKFPFFASSTGKAECTGLVAGELDLITVAQAFHWFDTVAFRKECHRILKSEGHIALIWNNRDDQSPLVLENADICRRFCPDFQGFSGGKSNELSAIETFFGKAGYEYNSFINNLKLDRNDFIGRNLSSSYSPVAGTEEYEGFIDELNCLFDRYARENTLILPNITKSYLGNRDGVPCHPPSCIKVPPARLHGEIH